MHTISSYHGNRPTLSATDRGDYNTLRRSLASSVNIQAPAPQNPHPSDEDSVDQVCMEPEPKFHCKKEK